MRPWPWACAGAVTFAVMFVWFAGHRGVFLLDQSIMFDGAWRIYQGQVPYRDFLSAFPPVPFLIQSLFFRLMGVSFSAMVLGGAVVNGFATLCVMWIIRRLVPDQPVAALAGGLITAVWFQAPFGTLWFEQTAFFVNLLALVLLVTCLGAGPTAAIACRVGAGVLLSVSLLCKQNAGADFVPLALAISAVPQWDRKAKAVRSVIEVLVGMALGASIFALWLWIFSSPATFWKLYVVMAKQIGSDRSGIMGTLGAMFPLLMTWNFVIVALLIFAVGFTKTRVAYMPAATRNLIMWIVVGCAFYQNLFKMHTDNEVENSVAFVGLIYGLSFGVFWKHAVVAETPRTDRVKWALFLSIGFLILGYPVYRGAKVSWTRGVQQFEGGAVFTDYVQVPRMARVVWGEPTPYSKESTVTRADFEGLNAWLSEKQSNFFVFPDSTMLYGLQGRVSPQPWLYFSPGHSFLMDELPHVDEILVSELKRNDVRAIVLEKDSWVKNQNLWKSMPKLSAWIEDEFEKVKDFGIYEAREWRGDRR